MNGEASGLRERIRRAIETPVDESQKLLSELQDASVETKLSILISGWGRGLAAGLEELAIAVDELQRGDARVGREAPAVAAAAEPVLHRSSEEERAEDSVSERPAGASEEQLLEQAKESRDQTAKLQKETAEVEDELAP